MGDYISLFVLCSIIKVSDRKEAGSNDNPNPNPNPNHIEMGEKGE